MTEGLLFLIGKTFIDFPRKYMTLYATFLRLEGKIALHRKFEQTILSLPS